MIKPYLKDFITRIFIFSSCCFVLAIILYFILPSEFISVNVWFLFPFYIAVTTIIFLLIAKFSASQPAKFIGRFMLITFLKLVFLLIILVVYAFKNKEDAIAFIIDFFVLYILYSVFEIISALDFLKKHNSNNTPQSS